MSRGTDVQSNRAALGSQAAVISSAMSTSDVIAMLVQHGCKDLTGELDLRKCGRVPWSGGGFGDVYKGTLNGGDPVAIKYLRMYPKENGTTSKAQQHAAREVYQWSKLKHRNILNLLGLGIFRDHISTISPWMEGGALMEYIKRNPAVDRRELCSQISEGLAYLHQSDILHGDIKAANVLVSQESTAKLMNFNSTKLKESTEELSIRWQAPEVLGGSAVKSKESDVHALGRTILEILTGKQPFNERSNREVFGAVLVEHQIPERPKDFASLNEEPLWELMVQTWSYEPSKRPSSMAVRDALHRIKLQSTQPDPDASSWGQSLSPPLSSLPSSKHTSSVSQSPLSSVSDQVTNKRAEKHRYRLVPTWTFDPLLPSPNLSSSQLMFPVSQSPLSGTNNRVANRPDKKRLAASKRLSAQDFELLIQAPSQSFELLRQYVGADSRYTLAAAHAGIYVRLSASSPDHMGRLKEATIALARVRDFVRFVHSIPKEELKSEQKGHLALRVCYSSLTALLGDFSGDVDVPADDPQAPIVSRNEFAGFRHVYPPVAQIMLDLSAELGTSVNTYKRRRSPSPSVVLKLQAMLKTLEVWNECLQDATFTEPTRIIRTWLENHPEQVNGVRRARGSSGQPPLIISDRRPSPSGQHDTIFPPGIEMHDLGQSPLVSEYDPGCDGAVSPSTTPGFPPPPMSHNKSLFGYCAPAFSPQAQAISRSSHLGSHPVALDSNYNLDFASIDVRDNLNESKA